MRIGSHEYANEADDDVPKPAQSLGTPVPRQKSALERAMKYKKKPKLFMMAKGQ